MHDATAGSMSDTTPPAPAWGRRAAIVAVVFAVVGIAAALPKLSSPIDRLINVKSNGRQPSYVNLADDAPIRAAARVIPDSATQTFFLQTDSTYGLDLYGASHLYFPPAVQVGDLTLARWIVVYDVKAPAIPPSRRVLHRYHFGSKLTLIELGPA
jgi:hypothetical protein